MATKELRKCSIFDVPQVAKKCDLFRKKVSKNFAEQKNCSIFALAISNGALVQLVRIRACHARGQGFESPTHRQEIGSVAQLNRVLDYGSSGSRFESWRSHEAIVLKDGR